MSDSGDEKPTPRLTEAGKRRVDARRERLAQALKENLRRRKAQKLARERSGQAAPKKP